MIVRYPVRSALRAAAVAAAASLCATQIAAQLRPLEPVPAEVFAPRRSLLAEAGVGRLHEQRASLAGTTGALRENGNLRLVWRDGRFGLELAGTVRRSFRDGERFAPPHSSVHREGPDRADSGDYRVGTLLHLTGTDRPAGLILRFGTRLPNSDDGVGLDRDRTDFYATLAGRLLLRGLALTAEGGLGIFGTHDPEFEQSDPLLYSLVAEQTAGPATLHAAFLGHRSGFGGWVQRGNETLSELRTGVRVGDRFSVQILRVVGLAEFSPASGWLLSGGYRR